ncbi:uncharacterized protein LOC110019862 [Phalaenopsis equestris]|uniref:uncharacterized protein LOC110019862 n=1 Tax=Phalaenopsis equestris TaxID=78828 RepID=UPI0009E4BF30|nr:uncharacterized protein LOC110019862 [Phalaenopsis equestris]
MLPATSRRSPNLWVSDFSLSPNDWSNSSRGHVLNPDTKVLFIISSKQYSAHFHFQPPQNWLNGFPAALARQNQIVTSYSQLSYRP